MLKWLSGLFEQATNKKYRYPDMAHKITCSKGISFCAKHYWIGLCKVKLKGSPWPHNRYYLTEIKLKKLSPLRIHDKC